VVDNKNKIEQQFGLLNLESDISYSSWRHLMARMADGKGTIQSIAERTQPR